MGETRATAAALRALAMVVASRDQEGVLTASATWQDPHTVFVNNATASALERHGLVAIDADIDCSIATPTLAGLDAVNATTESEDA